MAHKYTAKLYYGERVIADNSGDDIEQLYIWMIVQANGKLGDVHGEVMDNQTQKIIRQFRKSPAE